tara:strand:- start:1934 stop:2149 length:216 start_codon:yes stop_codon:yes gene_type:complete
VNCEQARLARLQFMVAQVVYYNPAELSDLANYAQAPTFALTSYLSKYFCLSSRLAFFKGNLPKDIYIQNGI